jgi:ABC-type sugar transport system substrate-binding protein
MMVRRLTRLPAAVLCALAAVGIAACGGSQHAASGSSSNQSGGKKHVTLQVLMPTLAVEFFQRDVSGMKQAAAADPNAEVTINAATDFAKTDEQLAKLEAMIAKRPDAILVGVAAPEQQAPILQRAIDSGIKTVVYDNVPGLHGHYSYVLPNQQKTGALVAGYLRKRLPHGGTLGIITCQPGFKAIDDRVAGIRKGIVGSGIKEVSYLRGDCDEAKGLNAAQNMLVAHPDLAAIATINGTMGLGAARAAKQAGKRPIIVSIDGTWAEADAILAGDMDATVSQTPEGQGRAGVEGAIALARGEPVPHVIQPPGVVLITKDNAAQFTKAGSGR